jgi:ATP-dependent RNA helicase RhlE
MNTFEDFKIKKQLQNAISDLGHENPTPIQKESFSPIMGGFDFVGIAQTGTGKTIAYLLPIIQELKYSDQQNPRVLILVPTRELVIQIVGQIEKLTPYISIRVVGVYGGSNNMSTQKSAVSEGVDIIVGTPRRLYDLTLTNVLRLKSIKKLVIDEVDIMLDFGYKTQLKNIFHYLPIKRQNILFSATMTNYIDELTVNLLNHLLQDIEEFSKVLIFVGTKTNANRLFEILDFQSEISVIHASKEQNYRTKSIENFTDGTSRILIATDVISRGIDIDDITTVINLDTPLYPENYMHRIGRTGRAERKGRTLLLYTDKETVLKDAIESLMNYTIPIIEFPEEVEISTQLTPEEKDKPVDYIQSDNRSVEKTGDAFHEKSTKNSKEVVYTKSYNDRIKKLHKKPVRRGDKIQNMKKKRKKK